MSERGQGARTRPVPAFSGARHFSERPPWVPGTFQSVPITSFWVSRYRLQSPDVRTRPGCQNETSPRLPRCQALLVGNRFPHKHTSESHPYWASSCRPWVPGNRPSRVPGTLRAPKQFAGLGVPGTFRGTVYRATIRLCFGVNEDGYTNVPYSPNFAACYRCLFAARHNWCLAPFGEFFLATKQLFQCGSQGNAPQPH